MRNGIYDSCIRSFRNRLLPSAFVAFMMASAGYAQNAPPKPQEILDLPSQGQDSTAQKAVLPAETPASPGAAPVTPVTTTPNDANPANTPLQLLPQPVPDSEKPQLPSISAPATPATAPSVATPATVPMPAPNQPVPAPLATPAQSPLSTTAAPEPEHSPVPVTTPGSSITPPFPLPATDTNNPSVPPPPATTPPAADAPVASPAQYPNLTIMFSSEEMAIVAKMIKAYDSYDEHKPVATEKDKLNDLFPTDDQSQAVAPPELPNLFLGSIVYNSPRNWVVTVNGKRISAQHNAPGNELYVTQISRKEIEIIWKPRSLNDVPEKWNEATEGGKKPLPDIAVDTANGTIKLHMHPNQTFIPSTLAIREGLIRPDASFFEKMKAAMDTLTKATNKQELPK